jgi:hypothetical protein
MVLLAVEAEEIEAAKSLTFGEGSASNSNQIHLSFSRVSLVSDRAMMLSERTALHQEGEVIIHIRPMLLALGCAV